MTATVNRREFVKALKSLDKESSTEITIAAHKSDSFKLWIETQSRRTSTAKAVDINGSWPAPLLLSVPRKEVDRFIAGLPRGNSWEIISLSPVADRDGHYLDLGYRNQYTRLKARQLDDLITLDYLEGPAFDIPAAYLDDLSWVARATAKTEDRPHLCSVNVKHIDGNLQFEATDGFRLHRVDVPSSPYDLPLSGTISPATIARLQGGGKATIQFSCDFTTITQGDLRVIQEIDAVFPNADYIFPIPGPETVKTTTNGAALDLLFRNMRGVATVTLCANGALSITAKMETRTKIDGIYIRANNDQPKTWETTLNPSYLADAVNGSNAETVITHHGHYYDPVEVTSGSRRAIVMPRNDR